MKDVGACCTFEEETSGDAASSRCEGNVGIYSGLEENESGRFLYEHVPSRGASGGGGVEQGGERDHPRLEAERFMIVRGRSTLGSVCTPLLVSLSLCLYVSHAPS